MVKIKISYSEDGEAAEVVAAIKRSARIRRVKYLKEGKYNRIYINADAFEREEEDKPDAENTEKHREIYIKNTESNRASGIKNPP